MSIKKSSHPTEYMRVSHQIRKQLIKMVEQKKLSIKASSELLNINYSTGKLIIKKYKKLGYITMFSDQTVNKAKESDSIENSDKQSERHIDSKNEQKIESNLCSNENQQVPTFAYYWVPNSNLAYTCPTAFYLTQYCQALNGVNTQNNGYLMPWSWF